VLEVKELDKSRLQLPGDVVFLRRCERFHQRGCARTHQEVTPGQHGSNKGPKGRKQNELPITHKASKLFEVSKRFGLLEPNCGGHRGRAQAEDQKK
jgi:hypothetical protein